MGDPEGLGAALGLGEAVAVGVALAVAVGVADAVGVEVCACPSLLRASASVAAAMMTGKPAVMIRSMRSSFRRYNAGLQ